MADMIIDWTDVADPPQATLFSQAHVSRLSTRLDVAIQRVKKRIDALNKEVRELQCTLSRMESTKDKLHEIVWAVTDIENIERLPELT